VLGHGLGAVVLGSALGLIAAVFAARALESLLFGVDAFEAGIFVGVFVLLVLVATVANAVPAFAASRLDPIRALREE
jgi:ABC-type antimicrobial peptide transport system permease subunit